MGSRFRADFSRCTRIIGVLRVLALVGLVQACSTLKIVYNQAPELAYWYLDGHLDLSGAQSLRLKDELARLQAWHRQSELPIYIATLQQLQQQLPQDLGADAVCAISTDVRSKLMTLSGRAEPAAAALADTLGAAQLAHLERSFAKDNARYREEVLDATPRERRDRRYKRTVSRAQMLYGRLDDAQLAVIGQRIEQSRFDAERAHLETLRRQNDALTTLRELASDQASGQPSTDRSQTAIRGLFERTWNATDPAERSYQVQITQDNCETLAAIHNSTTPAQRSEAVQTLRRYERDFTTLLSAKK
ncbi:MAG: hypothetical protein HHJ18_20325 [Polaromonas sp.]|nr:hypothetical protein [Polaromonas sp.]